MKLTIRKTAAILGIIIILLVATVPAFAAKADTSETIVNTEQVTEEEESADNSSNTKAIAAAALVGLVAAAGAIAMCIAISSGSTGISRQPEAAGNIRTNVMLGLVFIETAIIYALIVAILIIFVL